MSARRRSRCRPANVHYLLTDSVMSPILKPSTRTIIATQSRVEPSADRFVGYPQYPSRSPADAGAFLQDPENTAKPFSHAVNGPRLDLRLENAAYCRLACGRLAELLKFDGIEPRDEKTYGSVQLVPRRVGGPSLRSKSATAAEARGRSARGGCSLQSQWIYEHLDGRRRE